MSVTLFLAGGRRGGKHLIARILEKCHVDEGGCWVWDGAMSRKRRGRRPAVQLGGRQSPILNPARVMCELRHGPPPTPKHEAGHTCPDGENSRCVNPLHLEWMTRIENEAHKRTYEHSGL